MNDKAKSQPVTVDALQDLYGELRGSRSAPAIMDARAFFLERQWTDSHCKLNEAYEKYSESRQRILRQDPEKEVDAKAKDRDRQVRRLQRKQEKAREIIKKFESYLPQLKKLADKEDAKVAAKPATSTKAEPEPEVEVAAPVMPDREVIKKESVDQGVLEQFSVLIGERQLDFVSSHFDFQPLAVADDVKADAVYLLRKGDQCLMLHADFTSGEDSKLMCIDICNAKNHVELSRNAMVRLSQNRKLVLLLAKDKV